MRRQHLRRDRFGDQQRLHGVAGAVALGLGVVGDAHRHLGVGAVVDVHVAHAVEVLDHRDARLARQALDQLLAAARHDDVDVLAHGDELAHRGAVGRVDQLDRGFRQAGRFQPGAHAIGDGAVRLERLRAAAQDAGVARLDAQRRRVGGHVGARFVDDADHAERHAHLRHLDAGRPRHALRDRADRIGQRRHLLDARGHLLDRALGEASAGRRTPRRSRLSSPFSRRARWRAGWCPTRRACRPPWPRALRSLRRSWRARALAPRRARRGPCPASGCVSRP